MSLTSIDGQTKPNFQKHVVRVIKKSRPKSVEPTKRRNQSHSIIKKYIDGADTLPKPTWGEFLNICEDRA